MLAQHFIQTFLHFGARFAMAAPWSTPPHRITPLPWRGAVERFTHPHNPRAKHVKKIVMPRA